KIRPALIQYCYECHAVDSDDVGGELLLDSRAGWSDGGETGPAIVPGKPRDSLLMRAMEYRDLEMPPDEKLPDSVIADFRRWINMGAPDPRKMPKSKIDEEPEEEVVDLWSLKPVQIHEPPPVQLADWPRNDLDRFVLHRLESQQMQPNEDATHETLIRRLYFDLIGLPPAAEIVDAFIADPSDEHYAAIVDQLLASTHFGERWGRHWLDVARYGESAGSSRDVLMLYAWRYRDFVIDAFNSDMPFDRFVTEQVAGDLLPAEGEEDRCRQRVATGLLAIGSKSLNGGNLTYDVIDDQIDVVSKAVLGLTVSCARCHDHKFDPIPTKDYYALAGIFLSTETRYGGGTKRPKTAQEKAKLYVILDADLDPEVAEAQAAARKKFDQLSRQVNSSRKRVKTLESEIPKAFLNQPDKTIPDDLDANVSKSIRQYQGANRILQQRLKGLDEARDGLGEEPQYALGVQDAKKVTDASVLIRGEKSQPGDKVNRGFLSAVAAEDIALNESSSGRVELAAWLVNPDNPLSPRVAVNRVWQHVMGSGIVDTVDNFGVSGGEPSHPELLDYLAHRFVREHDWSIKTLIRELVLSRTYRVSSKINQANYLKDPDNRLRWRMERRRLEAEPLRDAMLAVSGLLKRDRPAGSLVMQIGEGEVGRNIDTSVLEKPFHHRSVYLPVIRGIIPEELRLFDFPEPSNVQGLRDSNTTPTQSLFLMNSPFSLRIAESFAESLLDNSSLGSDEDRVREAHRRCFSTDPTPEQVQRDLQFIHRLTNNERSKKPTRTSTDVTHQKWTTYCQSLVASAPFRFID
ncbi:MAG: PSD1 and planctomycete cytochrome C domain-containing protein, partial [Rubripirellula sp.]